MVRAGRFTPALPLPMAAGASRGAPPGGGVSDHWLLEDLYKCYLGSPGATVRLVVIETRVLVELGQAVVGAAYLYIQYITVIQPTLTRVPEQSESLEQPPSASAHRRPPVLRVGQVCSLM